MSRCDLHLENYRDQYVGGQTIVGKVICTFNDEKQVNSIYVRIKGEATTHWTESESHYDSQAKRHTSKTVHYHGSEVFFSHQIPLLPNRGGETTIAPGVHQYPFNFTLPVDLPSTFAGAHGKIKYNIKAVVERPFLKFNYDADADIVVYAPLDLNRDVRLREPIVRSEDKNFSILCWNKGNLSVQVKVPFTGFALGQSVPIHISVQNLSQITVGTVKVKVLKIIEFQSRTPHIKTRHSSEEIFAAHYSGVGAHGHNVYDKEITIKDSYICPNLTCSHIITVAYKLQVKLLVPCPYSNLVIDIPIMVGNIPIRSTVAAPLLSPHSPVSYGTPSAPRAVSPPPQYGFVPPQPAYNQSTMPVQMPSPLPAKPQFDETDISDEVNQDGFVEIPSGSGVSTMPEIPTLPLPTGAPSAPPTDNWRAPYPSNQGLPTYDQAMSMSKK